MNDPFDFIFPLIIGIGISLVGALIMIMVINIVEPNPSNGLPSNVEEFYLQDGVHCLRYSGHNVTCDWGHPKPRYDVGTCSLTADPG